MPRTFTFLRVAGLLLAVHASLLSAPDPAAGAAEAKLRESLKNTMLQLRAAEGEKAVLQTAKAELDQKNKTLTDDVARMAKEAAADKVDSEKAIADLKGKMADHVTEAARLNEALTKWKAGYQQAAEVARKKESDRAALSEKAIGLDRRVADLERRNLELYKTGSEILTRYEKFGLGSALLAREPFTGITRVKLETLVQGYADKLHDQKIKPTGSKPTGREPSGAIPARPPAAPSTETHPTPPKNPNNASEDTPSIKKVNP